MAVTGDARSSYDRSMTTGESHTLLSVRGEAQRTVAADEATVYLSVSATRAAKPEATSDVAGAVAGLTAELATLGGEVLTAQNTRAPLTWSTQSMRTSAEHAQDRTTGEYGPTGRQISSVSLLITVRDFALLGRVQAALTERNSVDVHSVQWSVDDDNPEWATVRADAIHAAVLKGQDYASALGGSVIGVEHVADAGLLGGDASGGRAYVAQAASLSLGGEADIASLDPVPQPLSATIEARLTAIVGALPTR